MLGEQAKYPNGYAQTDIYIQKQEGTISGVAVHRLDDQAWKFEDVVMLMRIFEVFFNAAEFPQATHQLRNFSNGVDHKKRGLELLSDMKTNEIPEEKPTFVVKIQYRQNASWQGTVTWVEKNKEKNFRSTLELIKLMDEAIEGDQDQERWD